MSENYMDGPGEPLRMDDGRDPDSINFRNVVNDLMVHPWEPMPEVQPPTVTALIAYLKTCPGWDATALQQDDWRGEGTCLRYGLRKQFWLPTIATKEELELLESFAKVPDDIIPCPLCQKKMDFSEDWTVGTHEENHILVCMDCDIKISRYCGISRTPASIASVFKKVSQK